MILALNLKYNVGLRGATGTGKTYLIKELAKALGKKVIVLNMTAHTVTDEVKGKYVVEGNSVTWVDGAATEAMKQGYWLIVEEANYMNEELASVFYSIMDDRREIILDEHNKEVIIAHEDCIVTGKQIGRAHV